MLDVAKDKVLSRRQTTQYGKAKSTQQRRILTKEGAIFRGGALKPFIYKGSRGDYPQTPYPRGFRRGCPEMPCLHGLQRRLLANFSVAAPRPFRF